MRAREPTGGGRQEVTVVGMGRVAWADSAGDRHFVGQRRCRATAAGGRARVWWSAIGSGGARGGGCCGVGVGLAGAGSGGRLSAAAAEAGAGARGGGRRRSLL